MPIAYTKHIIMLSARRSATFRLPLPRPAKDVKTHCAICENKFQLIVNQQHQCKRCLRAICIQCSTSRIKIYQTDGTSAIHKICKVCQREEDALTAMIRQNGLLFQMSSRISEDWMKKLNKERLNFEEIINEFEEMKFQTNSNTIKFKSESKRIFQELFKTYNYSMRQFIGKLTEQLRDESIHQSIVNITVAMYAYLKTMPYIPQLVYLVVFLLCFCNEFQVYFLLTRFIEKIYPQYLRLQNMKRDNLLTHELKMLLDMYKLLARRRVEKEEMGVVAHYLESRFTTMVKSFTINITNVSNSYYIIDEMFRNSSYIYLYKGISAIIFNAREPICQQQEPNAVDEYILSEVNIDKLKSAVMVFEQSNSKFEMDHQFFDSAQHRKLHQKYKQLESLYQKSDQKYKTLENKHIALSKEYEQTAAQLAEQTKKVMAMQEELLLLADKMMLVEDVERYKEENDMLIMRDKHAAETIKVLEQKLEAANKKYCMEEISRKMYIKMQDDYERQIVDLKTKNEVYQIQRMANDVKFQTSFIDQRFEQKNKRIADLQYKNKKMQDELQFYRNSRPSDYAAGANNINYQRQNRSSDLFAANISFIPNKLQEMRSNSFEGSLNFTSFMGTNREDRGAVKKILQANKQLIQKLKKDLKHAEQMGQQLKKEITKLTLTLESQRTQLQMTAQINNFMNEAPEQINYSHSIFQFQKIISKQSNHHRKTELQSILTNFRKCLFESKYRSIDAKLKQNRIRQLMGVPTPIRANSLLSRQPSSALLDPKFLQQSPLNTSQNEDIIMKLNWMSSVEEGADMSKIRLRQQTCLLM